MKEYIYIFFQVCLFDIIFIMFKMTDLIILAEQFTFFWDGPFFHRRGQHGPFFLQAGMNTSEPMSEEINCLYM